MPPRILNAALLAATVLLLALPAASHAATVAGGVDDRVDGVDNLQQDIRSAAVFYASDGALRGGVELGEPPTSAGVTGIGVILGKWSKQRGWCSEAADVDLRPPTPDEPEWFGGLYIGSDENGLVGLVTPRESIVLFDTSADQAAGMGWNCAWAETFGPAHDPKTDDTKVNDETDVFSLTGQQARNFRAKPKCNIKKRRVTRGGTVRLRCSNVKGRLTVRLYRGTKLKRTVPFKGGRVSTRGLRKGVWRVLVWKGSDVLGSDVVTVR